jgi:hypothetical protein
MTNGQIAQVRELEKCYMATRADKNIMNWWLYWLDSYSVDMLTDRNQGFYFSKKQLRRLWHAYRHQIAAMRKNRARL